jgi:uncharacterized repeat protein (TIGR03803 family)
LIFDAAGNLYGTTSAGGTYGYGTVYELTPKVGGGWAETILHSFNDDGSDGFSPFHASLILDGLGNLYGTTYFGGTYGRGTVFELTPATGGIWTETVPHSFSFTWGEGGGDGIYPEAGLTLDSAGNLYGTTLKGGAHYPNEEGTVFELTPEAGGGWVEHILHSFGGVDGWNPAAALIFDSEGNLYGTTLSFGRDGGGTVFELTPQAGGGWTETLLQTFSYNGSDGFFPSDLVFGSEGKLCGMTNVGGH